MVLRDLQSYRQLKQKPPEIRPLMWRDMPSLHACYDIIAKERQFVRHTQAPAYDVFCRQRMAHYGDDIQYIAHDCEKVVGYCDINRDRDGEQYAHCGELHIGIHPQYRGLGVGRRLLETAIRQAQQRGIERIALHALADNAVAIHMYEKFGFEHEGIHRNVWKIGDHYRDAVSMALVT